MIVGGEGTKYLELVRDKLFFFKLKRVAQKNKETKMLGIILCRACFRPSNRVKTTQNTKHKTKTQTKTKYTQKQTPPLSYEVEPVEYQVPGRSASMIGILNPQTPKQPLTPLEPLTPPYTKPK